jgi:dTDP-4-dehydrorhamnose 3,5-epimerase
MEVDETEIPGVLLLKPNVFGDQRGWFMESWQSERYASLGIPEQFVQDNMAYSEQGVLRGLHIQNPYGQGKLVQVIKGEVFDVAVDIRKGSPNFGKWVGVPLSADQHRQLFIPEGFAHGFCVLSDDAVFSYKCSDFYSPEAEHGIAWNDARVGIEWPVEDPILSEKDDSFSHLKDVPLSDLPDYGV